MDLTDREKLELTTDLLYNGFVALDEAPYFSGIHFYRAQSDVQIDAIFQSLRSHFQEDHTSLVYACQFAHVSNYIQLGDNDAAKELLEQLVERDVVIMHLDLYMRTLGIDYLGESLKRGGMLTPRESDKIAFEKFAVDSEPGKYLKAKYIVIFMENETGYEAHLLSDGSRLSDSKSQVLGFTSEQIGSDVTLEDIKKRVDVRMKGSDYVAIISQSEEFSEYIATRYKIQLVGPYIRQHILGDESPGL